MIRQDRLIFSIACLGMLLFGITLITLGSVAAVIQQRFSLNSVSSGALFSILPFGILAGSLVFGPVADRYGYRLILQIAAVSMFAGFQGIAYAPTISTLGVCVFFFGFGGGAINGAANAVVSDITVKNKGANLSLLGVFFAIGALGMPVVIASLRQTYDVDLFVSLIGSLPLVFAILVQFVPFHHAKQLTGVSTAQIGQLLKDDVLLLIGFFLFFQSGFEAFINNWAVTYLSNWMPVSDALYGLSVYVAALAAARLVLGAVLRRTAPKLVVIVSMILLALGSAALFLTGSWWMFAGLILVGAGLAAGFPVMLGLVGNRFADVSGTAFSVAISIALVGNMLINYGIGILLHYAGAGFFTLAIAITVCMSVLTLFIFSRLKSNP